MDFEITPEPSPIEREALETALAELLAPATMPAAYASSWRRTGIRENVAADEDYATTPRRRSPGATRA